MIMREPEAVASARIALESGLPEEAARFAEDAFELGAAGLELRLVYADCCILLFRQDSAIARLIEFPQAERDHEAQRQLALGRLRWSMGNSGSARDHFRSVLNLDPSNCHAIASLGAMDLDAGFMSNAERAKTSLESVDCPDGSAEPFLLRFAIARRDTITATRLLARSLARSRESYAQLSQYLRDSANSCKSSVIASRLIVLPDFSPKLPGDLVAFAEILSCKGDVTGARQVYLQASGLAPGNPWVLLNWARLEHAHNDTSLALRILDRALDLVPDFEPALHQKAVVLFDAGRRAEAAQCARAVWPTHQGRSDLFRILVYNELGPLRVFGLVNRDSSDRTRLKNFLQLTKEYKRARA